MSEGKATKSKSKVKVATMKTNDETDEKDNTIDDSDSLVAYTSRIDCRSCQSIDDSEKPCAGVATEDHEDHRNH